MPDESASISVADLLAMIDHTNLKPEASAAEMRRLCDEARTHRFAAVCVNPCRVDLAAEVLGDCDVRVASVAGFPLGASTTGVKIAEAVQAIEHGASEIDVVQNIGWAREGRFDDIRDELIRLVDAIDGRACLKVIIECCLLDDAQKRACCRAAAEAGADFVKTSTGFAASGATVEDVRLMREVVGPDLGVKAAGGIGSFEMAVAMVRGGATRIGASRSVELLSGAPHDGPGHRL
ncbi:MAG: deoxyribose-phosphate aldolase [Planctomycetes bacterium]|jgi:deoxyribose-phosphate aldolase|nr:deoxyribose-phosphate aldolase [Phycisphaerae bacterium]NBB94620.1 deoxyribose-phosphate aldolase [Planctomycetota bacterium]